MKFNAALILSVLSVAPVTAQEWHREGPVFVEDQHHCLAVSPQELGVRINTAGEIWDLAFFKVPVSQLTLLNLRDIEQKDIWVLMQVDKDYTAYSKAFLGPITRKENDIAVVDVFVGSSDFHLYEAVKRGLHLHAIIGEGFEFKLNIEEVPGVINTYALLDSSAAIGWAEDCIKQTLYEQNK